jgi:hypothetical protein
MYAWEQMSLQIPHILSRGRWPLQNTSRTARTDKPRNMEDFVTWVDSSKIKRNIMKYRDKLDDFELEAL